jgi:Tfp pilus assembly protein PilN
MINLLPPDIKENYVYARRNTLLRHWVVAFTFGLIGILGITSFGIFTIQGSINNYNRQVADATGILSKNKLTDTNKEVQDITNNLKLVVQVLSREILFSKMLRQMAIVTPKNVALAGLNIIDNQQGIDITANAKDYNAATQLQVNLTNPANQIFTKADIQSIHCTGTPNPDYPCVVVIRALLGQNTPFLFINSQGHQAKSSGATP